MRYLMTHRTCRSVAGFLLLALFPLPAFAQAALQRVRQSGELRVGTDATYPPFGTAEMTLPNGRTTNLKRHRF